MASPTAPSPPRALRQLAAIPLILALVAGCRGAPRVSREPALPGPTFAEGYDAVLFAPGIISTGDVFASSFTPDGRTVYFTKATPDRTRMSIMTSSWAGGRWSTPTVAPFSTGTRQMDPHVSPDGKSVLFTAPRRRSAVAADPDGDWDTWTARIDGKGDPTAATRFAGPANTDLHEMYPSMTIDDMLVFGVRDPANRIPGGLRYWHRKLRGDAAPVELGATVRNPGNPYITPNGRVLIFSATGPDPRRRTDLFVTTRRGDGRWREPQNLGLAVNTIDVEFCPQLSPDGQYLFFSRVHYDGERATGNDIYVIRTAAVPALVEALAAKP